MDELEKQTEALQDRVVDIIFNRKAGWSKKLEEVIKEALLVAYGDGYSDKPIK